MDYRFYKTKKKKKSVGPAYCFQIIIECGFSDLSHLSSARQKHSSEFLETLRIYDPFLVKHLKTATVIRGTCLSMQNDIIYALGDVILDKRKKKLMC